MRIILIGLTLFALFFGAGNLIFPVMLGQNAGDHFNIAILGFAITGVLMPLLGVIAMGVSGENDFLKIAQRNGKIFGLIFATLLYLAIGPLFAMPRTGSVSYEIGIRPFIDDQYNSLFLAIFSIIFYFVCCLLSLNSGKFIDIVGKFLTPTKIGFILILVLAALIFPMGKELPPMTEEYRDIPFITGFSEGYLTMDTLASLVFGIIVVKGVMDMGIKDKKDIVISCLKASLIAGAILAFFYISLAYMGATSVSTLGALENGGQVLARVSQFYFGQWGNLILGLMVTIACMVTNIGLTYACANYLFSLFPKISYRQYVVIFSVASALFANVGLTHLISFSVPVLSIIYPVTIMYIVLIFTNHLFYGKKAVYAGAIYLTLLTSILFELQTLLGFSPESISTLSGFNLFIYQINEFFVCYVPLYSDGLGWIVPGIAGGLIGYFISRVCPCNKKEQLS